MPVTAKFSERFYSRFGHDLTDELVSYLNQIDSSYRSELRELNEFNFARFDAKLEQRVAELRSEIKQENAMLRGEMSTGFADARSDRERIGAELRGEISIGFADARSERERIVTELRGEMSTSLADARSERQRNVAELRGEMSAGFARCKADLIKWMFVFWAGTTATVIGTMIALVKL